MKIAAAYVASFVCYWLGHAVSMVMNREITARLYPVYNRLMCWSSDVEQWAGIGFMWGPCPCGEPTCSESWEPGCGLGLDSDHAVPMDERK